MHEFWTPIMEFPNYSVSTMGGINNDDRGSPVRTSLNSHGVVKVGLFKEGVQYTRSVKVLVADHYLRSGWTNIMNTAIQLDGDPWNCRTDNLVWRPRWFAIKHALQFKNVSSVHLRGAVMDEETSDLYEHVLHAAVHNGLLFEDIWKSIYEGKPTFPTKQTFKIIWPERH